MPSSTPSLSVVIASYNYAQFLPAALDSVLALQPAVEKIIVVNDGSTDDSLEVLEDYCDRITLLNLENQGQLGACLSGLAEVETDYVYFLDADDFVSDDFTRVICRELESAPVKIQFQLNGVDEVGQPTGSVFPMFPADYTSEQMQADNRTMGFYQCPPTSGNIFHCKTLRSLNLDSSCKPAHLDATAPLVMPYFGSITTIQQPLAYYRVHGSNSSGWGNPTLKTLKDEVNNFQDTWAVATRVLNLAQPPFADDKPLYLAERELLIAAYENNWWLGGKVLRYIRKLFQTNVPIRNKVLLSAWTLGLLPPFSNYRKSVIKKRRSGTRSPFFRAMVRMLLHPASIFRRQTSSNPQAANA